MIPAMQSRKRAQSVGTQQFYRVEKPNTPTFGSKVLQQKPHPKVSKNVGLFSKITEQNEFLEISTTSVNVSEPRKPYKKPGLGLVLQSCIKELDEENHSTLTTLEIISKVQTLQQTPHSTKDNDQSGSYGKPLTHTLRRRTEVKQSSVSSRQTPSSNKIEILQVENEELIKSLKQQLKDKQNQWQSRFQSAIQTYQEIFKEQQDYYDSILKINRIHVDQQRQSYPQFDIQIE